MPSVSIEQEIVDLATTAMAKSQLETQEQYEDACEFLVSLRAMEAKIAEAFDPIIQQAYKAHKEALAQKEKLTRPVRIASQVVKDAVGRYLEAKEHEREQERRQLEDSARLYAAQEAEADGDIETATALLTGERTVAVVAPAPIPKVEGVAGRENWKFKITDESKIPRQYMIPDMSKIGAVVRALKQNANIPGVEVVREKCIIVRSSK